MSMHSQKEYWEKENPRMGKDRLSGKYSRRVLAGRANCGAFSGHGAASSAIGNGHARRNPSGTHP